MNTPHDPLVIVVAALAVAACDVPETTTAEVTSAAVVGEDPYLEGYYCAPGTCYRNDVADLLDPTAVDSAVDVTRYDVGTAVIAKSVQGPGATLGSANSVALDANAVSGDYAVDARATASTGNGAGLVARVRSGQGVALDLTRPNSGQLLSARVNGVERFSIDGDGTARSNGAPITKGPKGDKGDKGIKGDKGAKGNKGNDGAPGKGRTIAVCSSGASDCYGECMNGVVAGADGPCQIAADINWCQFGGTDGVCCICEL